jgi:hypothetical protein
VLRLAGPLLFSGLAVALPLAMIAYARVRAQSGVRAVLAVWLGAGVLGVLLSGSYSPPYVIELMPAAAVGMAITCARHPRLGVGAAAMAAFLALTPTLRGAVHDSADGFAQEARAIGSYVRARALPGQTLYVLYARANVLYYAGLPSPFPYDWALMMRAIPHAGDRLRALLAGPTRPTWIVAQDRPSSYGLDPGAHTAQLLSGHYRVVAHICHKPVLVVRGAAMRPAPHPERCR